MSRSKNCSCLMPAFILDEKKIHFRGAMTINIRRFMSNVNDTPKNQKSNQSESNVHAQLVENDKKISSGKLENTAVKRSFAQNLTVAQFIANKKQTVAPLVIAPKAEKIKKKQPAKTAQVSPKTDMNSKKKLQKTSTPNKQNKPTNCSKPRKTVIKELAKSKTFDWHNNVSIVYPEIQASKSNNGLCIHNKNVKLCPACSPDAYLIQRIYNVIENSMKRLNIPRQQNMLTLLGVHKKEEILHHFKKKMRNWNKMFPGKLMTITNINIDHIKPIYEFKRKQENLHFANHISNLQPLLKEDDAFKNCKWSKEDDFFWQENIAGQSYSNIYYPKQHFQPSVGRVRQ